MHKLTKGFLPTATALGLIGLLLLLEPDLGALGVVICIAMGILFLGGFNGVWLRRDRGDAGGYLQYGYRHVTLAARAYFRVPESVG